MDRAAVTRRVWELSEPLARAAGLELVDVQYRPEGGRLILRVLLDRFADHTDQTLAAGVTLDELARVSRELGDVLDAHDAVPGRYHLECSSPGLNRPLVRPEHFRRAIGQRVRVRMRDPIDGRRQFRGVLDDATEQSITVHDPDVGVVSLALAGIERASTEFEFPSPGGKGPRSAGGRGPRHAHA
ncbi:MAG TPA: ribosome maturation factor RimP [Candidatus Binatia bacterium]|nr:ribosome maturation factor RimP [Candidatus Binatia bacterium]